MPSHLKPSDCERWKEFWRLCITTKAPVVCPEPEAFLATTCAGGWTPPPIPEVKWGAIDSPRCRGPICPITVEEGQLCGAPSGGRAATARGQSARDRLDAPESIISAPTRFREVSQHRRCDVPRRRLRPSLQRSRLALGFVGRDATGVSFALCSAHQLEAPIGRQGHGTDAQRVPR